MSDTSATPSDVLSSTPSCTSTPYCASRTPAFGRMKCPTTFASAGCPTTVLQPPIATTPRTAILSQRAKLRGLTNRESPAGRSSERGGGIQDSAGSEHQRRLDDVALQQMRAEGAFSRDEGVARGADHREGRASEHARLAHMSAHDDGNPWRAPGPEVQ